jgi:hypothetical protein
VTGYTAIVKTSHETLKLKRRMFGKLIHLKDERFCTAYAGPYQMPTTVGPESATSVSAAFATLMATLKISRL